MENILLFKSAAVLTTAEVAANPTFLSAAHLSI